MTCISWFPNKNIYGEFLIWYESLKLKEEFANSC